MIVHWGKLETAVSRWTAAGLIYGAKRTPRPKPCVYCGGRYAARKAECPGLHAPYVFPQDRRR